MTSAPAPGADDAATPRPPVDLTADPGPLPEDNPLGRASALPYGLPDFGAIRTEHLAPAIAAGLAEQRREWAAVAADPGPPTLGNTLVPLERSGRLLTRALRALYLLVSTAGDDERYALEAAVAPVLASHWDAFYLDRDLAARVGAIAEAQAAGTAALDAEDAWLLHTYERAFRRAGALLPDGDRDRLRALNGEIARLETAFSQAVVRGMEAGAVVVGEAELAGVPEEVREAFAQAAAERGRRGYLIPLKLATPQPALADLPDRDLRRRVHEASVARGTGDPDRAAETDTRAMLLRLAHARAERAHLLGYAGHAAYVAEDGTAATTDAVARLLERAVAPAARNAHAEAAELAALLAADHPGASLEPWDWAFYAARVRRERYAASDADLRPYLEADRVLRNGVFRAAERLYGLRFAERPDLRPHLHAAQGRAFEVFDDDGAGLGLYVLDLYARPGKRGGAWMTSLVRGSELLGGRPVVVNELNVDAPAPGEPTLLSWDQVNTLFHEFGHALHGLFSRVRYPSLAGTAVPRDFVEYPSQVNEMWATEPEILTAYARHHETGEPLPAADVERLRAAERYGEGFRTLEYLAAALLDQAWHAGGAALPAAPEEVERFEADALSRAGVADPLVPPRYRSTYFNHTFGGGYDAAYYSYLWSDALAADTEAWFRGQGGPDRAAGERFRRAVLARGHSRDPLASFRDLLGRDVDLTPLLARRNLL